MQIEISAADLDRLRQRHDDFAKTAAGTALIAIAKRVTENPERFVLHPSQPNLMPIARL